VKLVTTLLVAVLAGLGIYLARRRIKLALTTAAVVYFVLLPIRLILAAGDLADRVESLALPALLVFAVWYVLTKASTTYERRKLRERARARPADTRRRR
jgi:hypothetical protein